MRDFLGFLIGRVDLLAESNQSEQFLNQLRRRKIHPLHLRCIPDGQLLFTLSPKAFRRLREPAFKTGTRIKILKKRGLFIWMRPLRRRWGLVAGCLAFIGFLFACSGFIWRVEVDGCDRLSETQLLEELQPLGFYLGCRRNIDVATIENRYLTGNDYLSWFSINIKGTTAYIEVKEKDLTPETFDSSTPTHIFAARDGVILSITDFSGNRMVEKGDAVSAGDLLISGERLDSYGVVRRVRAIGSITARTFRKKQFSIPFSEEVRRKTGREKRFSTIFLGKLKIPLYFNQNISYNRYDILSKEQTLRLGAFALPIRWKTTIYREVEIEKLERSEEEAKKLARSALAAYERDQLAMVKVIGREEQFSQKDHRFVMEVLLTCEEEIGFEKKIED